MFKQIFYLAIFAVVTLCCSPQKDRFINRQYHSLNTKYNVLFNGKEALKIGETILETTIQDNFYEILETDPILLSGENFENNTIVPGFQKAEDKAVKAIQMRSMNFDGIQKNTEIDDAYLLLGKARYYDRRFFPAIEAFNFLLDNYNDPLIFIEGRIWREKTNIRLQNNQIAINNLRPLARQLIYKNPLFAKANATVAQAFINLNKLDSAVIYISRAAKHDKKLDQKIRYSYIAGQLHENLSNKDSALSYYNSIVELNWKAPRNFWINAKINSLNISNKIHETEFVNPAKELLEVYENKPFSHTINRSIGMHFKSKGEDSLVKMYLKKSLKSPKIDLFTQQKNYRDLADLNFKNKKYLLAGSYLDSLLILLPQESLIKKKTQRERDNLSDILFFENQFRKSDSVLKLLSLSKKEQIKFFEDFLLNKRREALLKIENDKKNRKGLIKFGTKKPPEFYFYNPEILLKGKQSFASLWGKRPNIDNWRNKVQVKLSAEKPKQKTNNKGFNFPVLEFESVEFYMNQIPTSLSIIDSLIQQKHQATLKLGLIYKEKYKEKDLAVKNFSYLIEEKADSIFVSPALYHLYKIYLVDSTQKANKYKNKLIKEFPYSPYSKVLLDPENFDVNELKTPKAIYNRVIKKYLSGKHKEALTLLNEVELVLIPTEWGPKATLLKAQILGRLYGKTIWKQTLEELIKEFPNSLSAEKAKSDILFSETKFKENTKKLVEFKWVFPIKDKEEIFTKDLIDSLKANIIPLKNDDWKITNDLYNNEYQFIVIHGIKSRDTIKKIKSKLPMYITRLLDTNNFVALSSQYRKLFINKTWDRVKE